MCLLASVCTQIYLRKWTKSDRTSFWGHLGASLPEFLFFFINMVCVSYSTGLYNWQSEWENIGINRLFLYINMCLCRCCTTCRCRKRLIWRSICCPASYTLLFSKSRRKVCVEPLHLYSVSDVTAALNLMWMFFQSWLKTSRLCVRLSSSSRLMPVNFCVTPAPTSRKWRWGSRHSLRLLLGSLCEHVSVLCCQDVINQMSAVEAVVARARSLKAKFGIIKGERVEDGDDLER